jgi:hypothetical protein
MPMAPLSHVGSWGPLRRCFFAELCRPIVPVPALSNRSHRSSQFTSGAYGVVPGLSRDAAVTYGAPLWIRTLWPFGCVRALAGALSITPTLVSTATRRTVLRS